MKIKIKKNLDKFKDLLGLAEIVGIETILKFTQEKLSIIVTHGGIVGLSIEFQKEFFDEYKINEKEEFGIIVKDLSIPLKKIGGEFTFYDQDGLLVITSPTDKYTIPILAEVEGSSDLPKVEYTYSTTIKFVTLLTGLDKAKVINVEALKLYVKNEKLMMFGEKGARSIDIELADAENTDEEINIGLSLLKLIASGSQETIQLYMEKDKPLQITYETTNANMLFMIAPRV